MLSERDKNSIQKQIDLLVAGNFDSENIELLLVRIRDNVIKKDSLLKEICHFSAHSKRTKGYTFDLTLKKVSDMLTKLKKGGKWKVEPIFNKDDLFDELVEFLLINNISINKSQLTNNKNLFFKSLFNFLDKIEIDIRNQDIDKIVFEYYIDKLNDFHMVFVITLNKDIAGVVHLRKNVSIALPLF